MYSHCDYTFYNGIRARLIVEWGCWKLADCGYQYVTDKSSKDGTKLFWSCDQHAKGCEAWLDTDAATDHIVRQMHDHNHGSSAATPVDPKCKASIICLSV